MVGKEGEKDGYERGPGKYYIKGFGLPLILFEVVKTLSPI